MTRPEPTPNQALLRYGWANCREAYRMSLDGCGPNTVGWELDLHHVGCDDGPEADQARSGPDCCHSDYCRTVAANDAIAAGRAIAERRGASS